MIWQLGIHATSVQAFGARVSSRTVGGRTGEPEFFRLESILASTAMRRTACVWLKRAHPLFSALA
eukprot:11170473-Lingulodinium_polyedra.AAC.1